ncbi:MAG: pseudouridine synthase [Candidatus Riflebacteria bacterium HGW-Riflebacteria-2]|jgi:23S rRNA pseudouridine2605 synthase|nr:MAG: pseudouridine synthase [Candidatus Riflebacteria bacterium HGW-Riflebacteria-2]
MSEPVRIQKLLAGWGIASRRGIEKMIEAGRLEIDGNRLTTQGFSIDPENLPVIKLDGKVIEPPTGKQTSIYIFYKPINVVTTLKDEGGRKTIRDFLPADRRLYPVGRLDRDSTGLLLITDHGELTNRLLHPSYKVEKEYIVKIEGAPLSPEEQRQFRNGVTIEEGITSPCRLRQLDDPQSYSVTISEGKKRQVRRMFASFRRLVTSLHRVRFGPLHLGKLQPGELRLLTAEEKSALLQAAGLI